VALFEALLRAADFQLRAGGDMHGHVGAAMLEGVRATVRVRTSRPGATWDMLSMQKAAPFDDASVEWQMAPAETMRPDAERWFALHDALAAQLPGVEGPTGLEEPPPRVMTVTPVPTGDDDVMTVRYSVHVRLDGTAHRFEFTAEVVTGETWTLRSAAPRVSFDEQVALARALGPDLALVTCRRLDSGAHGTRWEVSAVDRDRQEQTVRLLVENPGQTPNTWRVVREAS
jgi:hypothetical protein